MVDPDLRVSARLFDAALAAVALALLILACGGTTTAPAPSAPPSATPQQSQAPSGNGPTSALQPGETTRSLTYAGIERTYLLHLPKGYDPTRPTPLVLAFHGISLNAQEMKRISGLSPQADASGFIVAYPNGTGDQQSWNGGHCCGQAAAKNVDDVGFVRALIGELATLLNIDPTRVYATGFSNGAIMVYRLACELSDRIAAIAPVGASQILDDQQACKPARNVPIIHFHGTADRLNPYAGGTTSAGYQFVPVEDAIGFWARTYACPASQQTQSGSIKHDVYAPCAKNSAVELYTVVGGEHAWPGGEAVSAQVGEPTMEISATPLIWKFFSAHPLP